MTLREFVNKTDNDIFLCIVRSEDNKTVFRRKHAYDVIPENLLDMEVGAVFSSYHRLYIHVKRNFYPLKCSFRELLNLINGYEYIDVYIDNRNGKKEKLYSDRIVFCTSAKYDNYLVQKVSLHKGEWKDKIEIVIEPCEEEMEELENREDCTARRDGKYRVGDRVYAPHFGEGIITEIDDRKTPAYPIEVQWEHVIPPYHSWHDCFTLDGQYTTSASNPEFDITPLEAIKVSECLKEGKRK